MVVLVIFHLVVDQLLQAVKVILQPTITQLLLVGIVTAQQITILLSQGGIAIILPVQRVLLLVVRKIKLLVVGRLLVVDVVM